MAFTKRAWTIDEARSAGEKDNPHGGKLVKWYMEIHDEEGNKVEDCYTQKKPGNNLSPGEVIYGRVDDGEYGPRFFGEKQDGYSPQEHGTGQSSSSSGEKDWDLHDHHVRWGLALKLASHMMGDVSLENYPTALETQAQRLLPIVENPPAIVVADAPAAAPEKPQEAAEQRPVQISREAVVEASRQYMDAAGPKDSVDRELAKNKLQLYLGSIGVEDPANMNDLQKQQVYDFLVAGGAGTGEEAPNTDDDIPFS